MHRLALLLLYLFAISAILQEKQDGSVAPLGLNTASPPHLQTDQGGGIDPLG
jgi:hypothetical protein